MLASLKAAGVGINLTAASRVYLMDPWWNPAVEEQAMDRVHRLGQARDVEVVRFAVRGEAARAETTSPRFLYVQYDPPPAGG